MGKQERAITYNRMWCRQCDKWSHESRKLAKKAASSVDIGEGLRVYRCPINGWWHVAHRKTRKERGVSNL
jgi:hypothetical protein